VAKGSVRPTATFRDGMVTGSGGCNRYSAGYESDGDKLTIGKVAATRLACQPPADGVERAYFAALERVTRQRVDGGELVLLEDATPLLRFTAASPLGSWKVTSLQSGNALESPIAGTHLTADFKQDGTLSGNAGCNGYTTTYTLGGDAMTIKPAASTRKACAEPDGVMQQESAYLAALDTVASYDLAGEQLTLMRSDGTIAVMLTR
jgi:heat shock protein HslJ